MTWIQDAALAFANVAAACAGGWIAVRGLGRCYLSRKARRLGRLHLAVSARLHELKRQHDRLQQRADILLIRLSRQQERTDGLREISEASALAAQLFGALEDSPESRPMPLDHV
jgi:hypothetical protein